VLAGACESQPDPRRTNFKIDKPGVQAEYDKTTGRLKRLDVDTNKNGKIDAFTYMDGTRLDHIEIDRNEDGKIDRWEYYVDSKLTKVGTSSRGDGVVDEWAYQGPSGVLERVETDTDRDGKIDKWETFDPPRIPGAPPVLRSSALDPDHTGKPTLTLFYRPDGSFERSEKK